SLRPGERPTIGAFNRAGFAFPAYGDYYRGFGGEAWPTPFLVEDFDGDGRPDVAFAAPGDGPSVCLLFRNTRQGWIPYRFGAGVPALGLSSFDIGRGQGKAIVLPSLAGNPYQPNLFFDVFTWRSGRLENVLSATIPNGWQWEHRDPDGDGL